MTTENPSNILKAATCLPYLPLKTNHLLKLEEKNVIKKASDKNRSQLAFCALKRERPDSEIVMILSATSPK